MHASAPPCSYADGASFAGYRADAINVSGTPIYYRGRAILDAAIDYLISTAPALEEVVFKGCSAGGLATILHLDYFAERVHAAFPAARVVGMPDAGFFR